MPQDHIMPKSFKRFLKVFSNGVTYYFWILMLRMSTLYKNVNLFIFCIAPYFGRLRDILLFKIVNLKTVSSLGEEHIKRSIWPKYYFIWTFLIKIIVIFQKLLPISGICLHVAQYRMLPQAFFRNFRMSHLSLQNFGLLIPLVQWTL